MTPSSPLPAALRSLWERAWRDCDIAARAPLLVELDRAIEADDAVTIAWCCLGLTRLAEKGGDIEESLRWLDLGVSRLAPFREAHGIAWLKLLNYQGYLLSGTGRVALALPPLLSALPVALGLGELDEANQAAINLACILLDLGEIAGAERYAVVTQQTLLDQRPQKVAELAWVQCRIAVIRKDRNTIVESISKMERLPSASPAVDRRNRGILALLRGYLAELDGEAMVSAAHGLAAETEFGPQTIPADLFEVQALVARALAAAGRPREALPVADRALSSAMLGVHPQRLAILQLRSRLYRSLGEDAAAWADAERAFELMNAPDPGGVAAALRDALEGRAVRQTREEELKVVTNALARANQDLEKAKAAAERAAGARARFLASMSHELRTPLLGVIGTADVLASGELGPEQRRLVDLIRRSGQLTLAVVDDVLDLRKLEEGKIALDPVPFSIVESLQDTLGMLRARAEAEGTRLELDLGEGLPPWVMGDDRRLSQVLLNLLGNAVKFARGGVVRLRVSVVDTQTLRFEVIDNGVGISPEQLPLIFDPYVQGGPATARRHGGTGLGLAIARGLVAAMGGQLRAESRLGEGSTFSFEVALPPVSLGAQPHGSLAARLDGLRVLVAEDNAVNLGVLRLLLESLGAHVLEAHDGGEALEAATAHGPDVLILDLHMPVLDGPAVAQRLRAEGYPGAILALTASVLSEDRILCLEAGMNAVATKPITRERLATALQALLRGRASA